MQGCARESPRTLWPHMDGAVHTFLPTRETNACLDHSTHGHVSAMFFFARWNSYVRSRRS